MDRFRYEPNTGKLYIDDRLCDVRNSSGYIIVWLDGVREYAHRIAWFIYHGYWPNQVDHINRDRADNRIENLREADFRTNQHNRGQKYIGATRSLRKWKAQIYVNGKPKYLGSYDTQQEASEAYWFYYLNM